MPVRTRLDREYVLHGVVVDRATQRGVRGVLVEAWDRDTKYHDMLGQVVTDADGAFTLAFDSDYFGNAAPDHGADLFFRVYMDDKEVLTTFDRPVRNLQPGTTDVRLEIELPQVQPLGRDRLTTEQTFKAIDWWQGSDFRGVFSQRRDQARTVSSMVGALIGDTFKNFDFQPLRPKTTREAEIVNQQSDTARVALQQQQVEVTSVQPASQLRSVSNARKLAGYPLALRPGDRVTLYEENGVVKYYTRDAAPAQTADSATVARIDEDVQTIKTRVAAMNDLHTELANVRSANDDVATRAAQESARADAQAQEVGRLTRQFEQIQQANAAKDAQIAKLQSDLLQVTKAHDSLAERLEARINRLAPQTAPAPTVRTGPVGAAAPKTQPKKKKKG
jgi:hypothetical protein